MAKWYDYIEYIFEMLPMACAIRDEVRSCGKFEKAIEIGCAIGGSTKFIKEISNKTYGIDISPSRIEIAQNRFKDIIFSVMDARHTTFEDEEFDASFLIMVLHEVPNPDIIKEACRISKKVIVIDYNPPVKGMWGKFFQWIEGDKIPNFSKFQIENIFKQCKYNLVNKKIFFEDNFIKYTFAK